MGIHRFPVNSFHKGPVTRKMFPFDDVIMETNFCESLIEWWQYANKACHLKKGGTIFHAQICHSVLRASQKWSILRQRNISFLLGWISYKNNCLLAATVFQFGAICQYIWLTTNRVNNHIPQKIMGCNYSYKIYQPFSSTLDWIMSFNVTLGPSIKNDIIADAPVYTDIQPQLRQQK